MNYTSYKVDKNLGRQDILFAVARIPNSSKAYVAGSDFKIHEIDFDNAKPDIRSFLRTPAISLRWFSRMIPWFQGLTMASFRGGKPLQAKKSKP